MASSRRPGTNESKWSNPGGAGSWSAGVNTYGTSGAGRDYTALTTWETDTDINVVTAQVSPVLECHADAASFADGGLTVSHAVYDTSYFRIIRAASASRHLGEPSAGVLFAPTGGATTGIYMAEGGAVEDVECVMTADSADNSQAFLATAGRIVGCLGTSTNAGAGVGRGCSTGTGIPTVKLVNDVAYNCDSDGFYGRAANVVFYNCTAVGCGGYGFQYYFAAVVWKNCIGYNNATDFNGNGATGTTNNISKDTSAPGTGGDSKTLTFVDLANGDCRLVAGDTDAIGQGADLSGDAVFAFDDDIAFTVRS